MDWNWFFSSFSQSAAALLGIIGAFVISRLVGIDEKTKGYISEFRNLQIYSDKVSKKLKSRKFGWINRMFLEDNNDLRKQIENGEFEELNKEDTLKKIYEDDDRLFYYSKPIMKEFIELYENVAPESVEQQIPTNSAIDKLRGLNQNLSKLHLPKTPIPKDWKRINNEIEKIRDDLIEAFDLIKKFRKNHEDLQGFKSGFKAMKFVVIALIVAFPLVVIYPLHFLPVSQEGIGLTTNFKVILENFWSFKNLLLLFLLIFFESIFIYFFSFISSIQGELNNTLQKFSDSYTDIYKYCPYYRPDNRFVSSIQS